MASVAEPVVGEPEAARVADAPSTTTTRTCERSPRCAASTSAAAASHATSTPARLRLSVHAPLSPASRRRRAGAARAPSHVRAPRDISPSCPRPRPAARKYISNCHRLSGRANVRPQPRVHRSVCKHLHRVAILDLHSREQLYRSTEERVANARELVVSNCEYSSAFL